MTRLKILTAMLVLAGAACGDEDPPARPVDAAPGPGSDAPVPMIDGAVDAIVDGAVTREIVNVTADITANTTWTEDKIYVLGPPQKRLFINPDVTLTIMPGTEIRGDEGTGLVVARGAKIIAEGTAAKPIVFTSSQPSGQKTPGWWGGILILGAAPINTNKTPAAGPPSDEAQFEAFPTTESKGLFGGTVADDDSGVLRYVRIEFAGFAYQSGREFNNLSLCGVGSGTEIDYIQVHRGSDDGVELFGGTVNLKHIVSSQNEDDGFDTDNGWNGKAQFMVIQGVTHPAGLTDAANGYESDNHGTQASFRTAPRTQPTISNVTLIGDHAYSAALNYAAVFRRGTGGSYMNHLWYGFARGPEIRDLATKEQAEARALKIEYSMFFGNDVSATQLPPVQVRADGTPDPNDVDETSYFVGVPGTYDPHNQFVTANPGLSATGVISKEAPNFKPDAGSAILDATRAATPPADTFFDVNARFFGAIGDTDWTAGWTAYPQN
jgi:hypothetical protein